MGDDGLLGGTTSVDDLKITGNISTSANTSLIGGGGNNVDSDVVDSKPGVVHKDDPSDWGLPSGAAVHLPTVGNRQLQQVKTDQVGTSTQPLGGPGNLELGELEQLTITNDNESSCDMNTPSQIRKTWNAKYTLRSHFDGVRALAFHPTEPVLITASEDQTLKLWNLQKTIPAKKSAALDVEPVYTFRAHTGPVLSLAVAPDGDYCFSGGIDATIRCWNMPHSSIDPYDSYDPNVLAQTLTGHTDGVWSLAYLGGNHQKLLSASADGTVKLWSPFSKAGTVNAGQQLVKTFGYTPIAASRANEDSSSNSYNVVPTAVEAIAEDPLKHKVT
jgi:WD40 repeat protein